MKIKQFIRRKKKCRIIKKLAETVGVAGGVLVWCSVEGIDLTTLELWKGVIGVIIGMALVTAAYLAYRTAEYWSHKCI